MKYKKISFTKHPILGTVTFDLLSQVSGQPYQNVVIAGENGIGKTVLLQFINSFSPQQQIRDIGVVHLEIVIDSDDIHRLIEKTKKTYGERFKEGDFQNHEC